MTDASTTIATYWKAAEARDWKAFGATLADDVVYELPQTRERIRGKEAYVRFNREYPGDWHLRKTRHGTPTTTSWPSSRNPPRRPRTWPAR